METQFSISKNSISKDSTRKAKTTNKLIGDKIYPIENQSCPDARSIAAASPC